MANKNLGDYKKEGFNIGFYLRRILPESENLFYVDVYLIETKEPVGINTPGKFTTTFQKTLKPAGTPGNQRIDIIRTSYDTFDFDFNPNGHFINNDEYYNFDTSVDLKISKNFPIAVGNSIPFVIVGIEDDRPGIQARSFHVKLTEPNSGNILRISYNPISPTQHRLRISHNTSVGSIIKQSNTPRDVIATGIDRWGIDYQRNPTYNPIIYNP